MFIPHRQHDGRGNRAAWITALAVLFAVQASAPRVRGAEKPESVRLTIDYGDGTQLCFKVLPWRDSMTVMDALTAASQHPRGPRISKRGRGRSTFVTAIDDLQNEGNGKNWLFSVNGKTSKVGAGARQLDAGDEILWEYKAYEYN